MILLISYYIQLSQLELVDSVDISQWFIIVQQLKYPINHNSITISQPYKTPHNHIQQQISISIQQSYLLYIFHQILIHLTQPVNILKE